MKTTIAIILLAAASCGAGAQTAYRCGDTYSQQPCTGGTAMKLAPSQRSFDGAAQAHAVAQRDMKLADAMEKARLKEEAKPVSAYIPKPKPVGTLETPAKSTKAYKPDVFTAAVPGSKKPKKKKK